MRGIKEMPKTALGFLVKLLEAKKIVEQSKEAEAPTDGPKAYLISIVNRLQKPVTEADSGSAFPQMVRPGVKQEGGPGSGKKTPKKDQAPVGGNKKTLTPTHISKKKVVAPVQPIPQKQSDAKTVAKFNFTERDKTNDAPASIFDVILIKEGLGNWKDGFYYSKDALKGAAAQKVFEGEKIYADHPSESDEVNRPERSVRDILGYYTNVLYTESNEGQGMLVGKTVIPGAPAFDWARSLMSQAVDYSTKYQDKDFVGVSINASGDANPMNIDDMMNSGVPAPCLAKLQEAKAKGITEIKYVTVIGDAKSCDLVTAAGAGGKIVSEN
jgi:hypothetical protein